MHAQHFLIAERERSIYDSCRFDIGRSRARRLITKYVYTPVNICISQCPQLLAPYATRNPRVKKNQIQDTLLVNNLRRCRLCNDFLLLSLACLTKSHSVSPA